MEALKRLFEGAWKRSELLLKDFWYVSKEYMLSFFFINTYIFIELLQEVVPHYEIDSFFTDLGSNSEMAKILL